MMIITTFHWLLKTLIDFILKLIAVWRLIDATDKIIFKTSKQKYAGHIISTDGRNIMLILVFISVYQKLLNRSVMIKKYRYCIFAKYLLAFLRALEVFSRNVRFDFSWYSIVLDWAGLGWAGLDWTGLSPGREEVTESVPPDPDCGQCWARLCKYWSCRPPRRHETPD